MDADLAQDGLPSQSDIQTTDSNQTGLAPQPGSQLSQSQAQVAQAIAELDKMDKFKFQGREWTPKDLERAILRQQDYTKKTQELAEERKFYENLYADLNFVKSNPQHATDFIKTYPEKFHPYLKAVLNEAQQSQAQGQQQMQAQRPQIDVDLMSRLHKLESTLTEQEVAKNTEHINNTISRLEKKYPDAVSEMVIARVYEAYNQGVKPDDQIWEDTFKAVDQQMKDLVKARYGELVKKQTQVNAKARDVDPGGGTVGRAPKKFGSLKEATEAAVRDLTGRQ